MQNYTDLQAIVADYLMRSDLGHVIPTFIRNGESRINKRVRHRLMESTDALTFDANGVAGLPEDFVELRSLSVVHQGTKVFLEHVEPDSAEWLFRHRPSQPKYFTLVHEDAVTRPIFEGAGDLNYYARIPALTEIAPTNWLLEKFPEVYLYGSLIEGAVYLRDPALLAHFAELFNESTMGVMMDRRLSITGRQEGAPPLPAAETRDQVTP